MFSLTQFGRMLSDGVRHPAHLEALRRVVGPDSVVLDIGTGSGVYALAAARLGARKVYAIDPNPCVQLARRIAEDSGLADRIDFVCGDSTEVTFPEPADVIVSDLRDTLPFNGPHFAVAADARRRHLRDGGVMLPRRDVVLAAIVESEPVAKEVRGPWPAVADELGLDLGAALDHEANTVRYRHLTSDALLTDPVTFARLEYDTMPETDLDAATYSIEPIVPARREGVAHGVALWFDAELIDGVTYSTGPFGPATVYSMAVLPLRDPIALDSSDTVRVELSCRRLESWQWWWRVSASGPGGTRSGSPWRQTTLRTAIPTDERIRFAAGRVGITRQADLDRDQAILTRLAAGVRVSQVAEEMARTLGVTRDEAVELVVRLAGRYAGV